jgi:hypothetical protein
MRIPHLYSAFLELSPDGAVVDVEVVADTGQGLALSVEVFSFVDLLGSETADADRDASPLEGRSDGVRVDAEVFGEVACLPAGFVLATEGGDFVVGEALGARSGSCYNWTWGCLFGLGLCSSEQLTEPLTCVNMIRVGTH